MQRVDLKTGKLVEQGASGTSSDNDNATEVGSTIEVAVTADADAREAAVIQANDGGRAIEIAFAKFNDGRAFSIARLLRGQHGFSGELIAKGHVLPDQGLHLLRSGFDTAEIREASVADAWRQSLLAYGGAYQTATRNPLQRRREAVSGLHGTARAERLAVMLEAADTLPERIRLIAQAAGGGRVAFSTSLGREDQAILNAIAQSGVEVDVFTLDTLKHFPETLATLDLSEQRYGIAIRRVQPDSAELQDLVSRDGEDGFRVSIAQRKACCVVRKVQPLNRSLAGAAAWITGLRREQSPERSGVAMATWDGSLGLLKVSPLADWGLGELESYLADNSVPVNPLHARGFPSIGCQPCTRAVRPGEDERAGRWWWESQEGKECGLHSRPADHPRKVA